MTFDKGDLTALWNSVDSILRDNGFQITVLRPIVLEHSQEGGMHRVRLTDALRTLVYNELKVTPAEDMKSVKWYSDTDEFIYVARVYLAQLGL